MINSILAWPNDTGVLGGLITTLLIGIPAYIHTHLKINRHHRERMNAIRNQGTQR